MSKQKTTVDDYLERTLMSKRNTTPKVKKLQISINLGKAAIPWSLLGILEGSNAWSFITEHLLK